MGHGAWELTWCWVNQKPGFVVVGLAGSARSWVHGRLPASRVLGAWLGTSAPQAEGAGQCLDMLEAWVCESLVLPGTVESAGTTEVFFFFSFRSWYRAVIS